MAIVIEAVFVIVREAADSADIPITMLLDAFAPVIIILVTTS